MLRFISIIICSAIISFALCQPTWHILVIDSDGEVGYDCHLDLDNINKPHIAYCRWNSPNGYDLKYAYYNGSSWDIDVVESANGIFDSAIAVDNSENSHVSYLSYDSLKYAFLNGSNWQFNTIEQWGRYTAIAVDSQNHPHIAYQQIEVDVFKYAYFNGSSWIIQTVDPMYASGQGDNTSITTDTQNSPHISYQQDSIGQLRYAHRVSGSWVIEYPDTMQGSTGNSTSICLDSLGNPHISHCAPLRYCSKVGGTWQVQQVDSSSSIQFTSLTLDSNNYPHIAYRDTNLGLKMAHWNGSSWDIETVDSTLGAGFGVHLS